MEWSLSPESSARTEPRAFLEPMDKNPDPAAKYECALNTLTGHEDEEVALPMPADSDRRTPSNPSKEESDAKARRLRLQRTASHLSIVPGAKVCGSWLTDPNVFWRHPWARIFIVLSILVLDMLLFGEDPVNDSHVECNLPGLGHLLRLFVIWSGSTASCVIRVFLIIFAISFGCFFGIKVFHHMFLRDLCGLSMFSPTPATSSDKEERQKGTWFAMGCCVVPFLFVAILIHNLMLPDDEISSATGMEMRDFGKLAQCCSVTADLLAIIMVIDAVMQEEKLLDSSGHDKRRYPHWIPRVRAFYSNCWNGCFRIVLVWSVVIAAVVLFLWGILNTGKTKDDWRWDDRSFGGLTDVARAFLVLCVIFCDLFTVMQDWEFPTFDPSLDLEPPKIAGLWSSELNLGCLTWILTKLPSCPACLSACAKYLPDRSYFHITVSGPWLSYGPLLVVIMLDLFCMRTQFIYEPSAYGQYVHPSTERIWTIVDEQYLLLAYDNGVLKHSHMVSYSARWNETTGEALSASALTDIELNSRYLGSALKFVAIIPGFAMIFVFWIFVFVGNLSNAQAKVLLDMEESVARVFTQTKHTSQRETAKVVPEEEDDPVIALN